VQIPLGDMDADSFKLTIESGIKRFASGFTKTVALVTQKIDANTARFGTGGPQFRQLEEVLSAELNVKQEDLSDGHVDSQADVLVLAAPKDLDDKQLFAIDQFLMRGGTVIATTSPYSANLAGNRLSVQRHNSGLEEWLAHFGVELEQKMVMDPQNSAFPVPVTRQAGAFRFQEMRMIDYPYFADLRRDGLNQDNPITRDLSQLTMTWASPINIDKEKNSGRSASELLHSSEKAWLSESMDVMPQLGEDGRSLFRPQGEQGRQLLGAVVQGRFDSYFTGKESPMLAPTNADESDNTESEESNDDEAGNVISNVIEHSPESARIVLFGSNDFLSDQIIRIMGSSNGSQYLGSLQLAANTVEWSLEEQGLLSIRSRGHFNRTLPPMEKDAQIFWESANYVIVVLMLVAMSLWQGYRRRRRARYYYETLTVPVKK
jgi:ABC-2 type transport system permease protein